MGMYRKGARSFVGEKLKKQDFRGRKIASVVTVSETDTET